MQVTKKTISTFVIFLLICSYNNTKAQLNDSINDLSFIKSSKVWINSQNPSGLHHFLYSHTSRADISFNINKGNFTDYYQPDNSTNLHVNTESFNRLNKKTVFYGLINYLNFTGKNMGGSAFINPNEKPFNIVEYSNDNKGEKNKENYYLIGGLSYALTQNFFLGGKTSYTAANYVKNKDLRHKNKLLDIKLSLGFSYDLDKVELGLNYFYNRNTEEIAFNTFGNKDLQYSVLIDYGSFYGETETFDKTGKGFIHGTGSKPLFTKKQGGAFQFSINLGKHWNWFNQAKINTVNGYFGKKGSHSVLYTLHNGMEWNYKTTIQKSTEKKLQNITISAGNKTLKNYRNVITYVSIPGEIEDVEEIVKTRRLQKKYMYTYLTYNGYFCLKNTYPKWHINSNIKHYQNYQKTHFFPFYREQNINYYQINASIKRNFTKNTNHWWLKFGVGYGKGFGTKAKDYTSVSASSPPPRSTIFNLDKYFEYHTAPRIYINAQIKYGISSYISSLIYISLNYKHTRRLDTPNIKLEDFNEITMTVGIDF